MDPRRKDIPRRIHLVGIGGAGMSGIAEYLVSDGRKVTGSDLHDSRELRELASHGVIIFREHSVTNLAEAEAIVASDAVPRNNIELAEAQRRGLPVFRRAEFLSNLGAGKKQIYVAGSHGKTTTTAMITRTLESAGVKPAFVIGGNVPCLDDRRGKAGEGNSFIAEACEAFQNLSFFHADIAVITNIDDEHLEHYGSRARLDAAFLEFAQHADVLIANGNDPGVQRALSSLNEKAITFGLRSHNKISAASCRYGWDGSCFDVVVDGRAEGTVHVPIPGEHVVLNALACFATCSALGLSFDQIARGLGSFTGASRRWQDYGTVNGIRVIDDYAHHPAELAATIDTARALLGPSERLAIAFQPQLFSRTQRLQDELGAVLARCDEVFLLEIDPGGENDSGRVRSQFVADRIKSLDGKVELFEDVDDLVERAPGNLMHSGILLIAGAGSIRAAASRLFRALSVDPQSRDPRLTPVEVTGLSQQSLRKAAARAIESIFKKPDSVLALFQQQVRRHPDGRAVSNGSSPLSYRDLDLASDRFAEALSRQGIAPGTVVAVGLPFSMDLAVAAVGLLKLGAVYLPLDDSLPAERVSFMLTQSGARLVITSPGSKLDGALLTASVNKVYAHELRAAVPQDTSATIFVAGTRDGPLEHGVYICFTSGSTGYPKGVLLKEQGLFVLLSDIISRFGVNRKSRIALNTSISFDISLAEIWMTLCGGGELVVSGSSKPLVGDRLARFIRDQKITHLSVTPSVLGSMKPQPLPTLKYIIACGEACSEALVNTWAPGRRFFNAYGPTEATIYATAARCRVGKKVTIGRALRHVRTYVLDQNQEPVASGEPGELCLGGCGVATGYLDRAAEANEKFLRWPPDKSKTDSIYRTGDLVREDKGGNLLFLGRLDHQVKILGNRIELEEIEQAVKRLPRVLEAALCVNEGESKELICFVVTEAGELLDQTAAREQLSNWLPAYMLPSHLVRIDAIPMTSAGKKDRRALLAQFQRTVIRQHAFREPPRNEVERKLAAIWKEALEAGSEIGMYDDFAFMGGDSLRSLIVLGAIEERFGVSVPAGYFGRFNNINNMAIQVADLLWNQSATPTEGNASGFKAGRIYKQLRALAAAWRGERGDPEGLIVSVGRTDAKLDLFICLQLDDELQSLGKHLGDSMRVHGLRSGHLVMSYTPENVETLASHYLEELEAIAPTGPVLIGGVCQGGAIAHAVASKLIAKGRQIGPLVFIEYNRLVPYEGAITFIYTEDSYMNPARREDLGLSAYDQTYGGRYTLKIIPGEHGNIFHDPSIHFLAASLKAVARGA
ncbi:MAG: UDP-N-acetylmuramate--L-alanine ligase [Chthoniobacterales bacterium]|nr:UDP-N-acetylmuramate--L-alanine ligase [Chthoniobacterales bacterium]